MTDYTTLAARTLAKCAAYDPWFPKPSESLVNAWAEHLEIHKNLTLQDLLAAVTKVYNERGSGFRPLPKDITDAAHALRADAAKSAVVKDARALTGRGPASEEARKRAIAAFANRGLSGGGTFGGGLDLRSTCHGHIHFRDPGGSDR